MSKRFHPVARLFMAIVFFFVLPLRAADRGEAVLFQDTGPIRVREQFLIGLGYFAFDPTAADVLRPGQWQVDVIQSATNTWARSGSLRQVLESRTSRSGVEISQLRAIAPEHEGRGLYFVDGEVNRTSVAIRRGLGQNLELSATVPLLTFGGGALDGLIENFHHTFGFDQGGRTGAARDAYAVYLRDGSGRELFRDISSGTHLGDVTIGLKAKLPLPESQWNFAIQSVVELPTGSEKNLSSAGGVDYGTQLLFGRYFSRSCIHGSVGVVRVASSDVFGTDAQTLGSLMLGYEHALGRRSSAVVQLTASESPFRELGIDELSADAYLADIGIKYGLTPRTVVFAAISENLASYGSSPDVGFHAGVTWTK